MDHNWIVVALLAAFCIASMPEPGVGKTNILIDQSHCFAFAPDFIPRSAPEGFHATISHATLSPDFADRYQVLVLYAPWSCAQITAEQEEAIVAFVKKGGGLLIVGDGASWLANQRRDTPELKDTSGYELARLARRFGLDFPDEVSSRPLQLRRHPISAGIKEFQTEGSGVPSVVSAPAAAKPVVVGADGKACMVAMSFGRGRIVAATTMSNFLSYTTINDQFIKQLLVWVSAHAKPPAEPSELPGWVPPECSKKIDGVELLYAKTTSPETVEFFAEQVGRMQRGLADLIQLPPPPATRLTMYLHPGGVGSGWTSGPETIGVTIPPPGDLAAAVEVIGHELGHNWVRAAPAWFAEVLPGFLAMRVMEKIGYEAYVKKSSEGALKRYDEFRAQGQDVDLAAPPPAGALAGMIGTKGFWVLTTLEKEHGVGLWSRYIAIYRTRYGEGPVQSEVTTDDVVAMLSEAAGKDLRPFFAGIGTTLKDSPASARDAK